MMNQPVRVLIVDDDENIRRALTAYAQTSGTIEVVGTCANGAEGLAAVAKYQPDVVLLDIRMPVMDGITATSMIRATGSTAKVLLLTSFDTDDYVRSGLRAGASGFLLKDAEPKALADAIHAVHEGSIVLAPAPLSRLIRTQPVPQGSTKPSTAHTDLSPRELEILQLLCRAHANSEIAQELFLTESTVKGHVSAIMAKLGVKSRLKAVVKAYELGLVGRDV